MDDILTVQEVAEYLKISRSTIWRWCNTGVLPAFKVGRRWRVRRTILENLTNSRATKEVSPILQMARDEHECL